MNGISEGTYSHEAYVKLTEVLNPVPSDSTTPLPPIQLSAPSLMDLVHSENISPSEADRDALEQQLFDHPDPYDLAESDRNDQALNEPKVVRSQERFDIADYIKLDSSSLAALLMPPEAGTTSSGPVVPLAASAPSGHPDDWTFDEFLT